MSIADKLNTIAENEQKVYEAGRQKELSDIMDMVQDHGARKVYNYYLYMWSADKFYPKYDIVPISAAWFARDMNPNSPVIDLTERLNECGVKMDFSQCTDVTYLFYGARFFRLPELNLRNCNTNTYLFGGHTVTVDKLIIKDEESGGQEIGSIFGYASSLENIVVEGSIKPVSNGVGLNLQWSTKLSHSSLINLLNCLQDLSEDTSGKEWKIIIGEENIAKLTEEELNIAYEKGWTIY